jgi:hypothetical protein
MRVLTVTFTNCEPGVEAVFDAIRERGGEPFRFDADHYPTRDELAVEYSGGEERLILRAPGWELDLREVGAAWFHHTYVGYCIPPELDPDLREASQEASLAAVQGALVSLDAFLMDPFCHAESKQLQLRAAREAGLETPRTLITNDPRAVRRFAATCRGGLITKAVSMLRFNRYEESQFRKVYTSAVSEEDLADLDGLRLCPMIFQERIPKRLEVRLLVAGYRAFAAAIDSPATARGQVDWRRGYTELRDAWEPYALPAEVEAQLYKMMDRLGLNFGVIDMILTPDGRHVFLEVNFNGGGYEGIYSCFGAELAGAIADVLLGRARRRPPAPAHSYRPR